MPWASVSLYVTPGDNKGTHHAGSARVSQLTGPRTVQTSGPHTALFGSLLVRLLRLPPATEHLRGEGGGWSEGGKQGRQCLDPPLSPLKTTRAKLLPAGTENAQGNCVTLTRPAGATCSGSWAKQWEGLTDTMSNVAKEGARWRLLTLVPAAVGSDRGKLGTASQASWGWPHCQLCVVTDRTTEEPLTWGWTSASMLSPSSPGPGTGRPHGTRSINVACLRSVMEEEAGSGHPGALHGVSERRTMTR